MVEFNLIHNILNNYKHTKNTNDHHSTILHRCMNTYRCRSNIELYTFFRQQKYLNNYNDNTYVKLNKKTCCDSMAKIFGQYYN